MSLETIIHTFLVVIGSVLATKGIKNIKKEYAHLPVENILSTIIILGIIGIMYLGNYLLGILYILILVYASIK